MQIATTHTITIENEKSHLSFLYLAEKEAQWNVHLSDEVAKAGLSYKLKIEEMTEALKISDQKTQVRITLFALNWTLIYIFQYEIMLLSPASSSCHCKQNVILFYYILVYSTLIYSILLSFFLSSFLPFFLSFFLLSFFQNLSHFLSFHCLINSSG